MAQTKVCMKNGGTAIKTIPILRICTMDMLYYYIYVNERIAPRTIFKWKLTREWERETKWEHELKLMDRKEKVTHVLQKKQQQEKPWIANDIKDTHSHTHFTHAQSNHDKNKLKRFKCFCLCCCVLSCDIFRHTFDEGYSNVSFWQMLMCFA